ncbi:MAG: tetratricopeptide repeat protein [Acidobacteria bacterium]|nr:tetratricopeptide repeat protein [Acidobacteriota bacterium]
MTLLSPDRWRRLEASLDEVLDLPVEKRAGFLVILRARDPSFAADLATLLDEHRAADAEGFLMAGPDLRVGTAIAGDVIGPYRLVSPLGEGGMGEVWLAEQREPVRRDVAIKIIKQGMDTALVVARFEAERQALALMDHSAVAKVFDAGSTPLGRPYFVMEYVRGVAITEHCDRNRLTTRERLELFMRVCDGVQHAHQKALIHRDLKPSNVLVAMEDGRPVPKIIDFGVAKATSEGPADRPPQTIAGTLIGTPEYMSPEQADPACRDLDTRTDVYSLGVMLYELLVGVRPFDAGATREGGHDEIRRRIREEEPKRPSARLSGAGGALATESATRRGVDAVTLRRQLRGELDWIVMKALEKDRERRYGSAADLAADIRRHLGSLPVVAGPASAGYRARKFVGRHSVGVAFAALGVLALAGFAGAMALQSARIARERDRANREAKTATRALSVLTDLFEVSNPSAARGNTITAREILDRGAEKIDRELADEPLVRAQLTLTLTEVYRSLGLYDSARPLAEKTVALRREQLGAGSPEALEAVDVLGGVQQDQGKLAEAEISFREAFEGRRSILGKDDPAFLTSLNNLGLLLQLEGKLPEAERYLREALDVRRRTLGPDDPDLLMGLNNFGLLLQNEDKPSEAEPYFHEVLDKCRRTIGSDHPHTLTAMSNLGLDLMTEGKLAKAEPLFREALETRRRVFGGDHPQTLLSVHMMGYVLRIEGRLAEAEPYTRESVDGFRRAVGPEHPRTLMALTGMALLREAQGRFGEAEVTLRGVLETRRRTLGEDHPDTLDSLQNLAAVLHDEGKQVEAESILVDAVERSRRKMGSENASTLGAMAALGDVRTSRGSLDEAERLLAEVLAAARRALPPGHRLIGRTLLYAGRCQTARGRYPEAEASLIEARRTLERAEPFQLPRIEEALADLRAREGR